ncbi:MAG: MMPL family transporter, partial [Thermoanaerobaculia bacterium]|nr:MMPL family transporter [Thermoanaerobaculia bacterium]
VSYGRYVEERRRGSSVGRSIRRMSGSSGRAVVVGAVTSAATFYAFLVTDFTGLRQMGIIAGSGILICMVTVLVLLPAMLVWNEEHHRKRESRPTMYLHAFGAAHLVRWSVKRPRTTLLVGGLITVVLAGFGFTLEFQDSMREMRSPENRGVRALDEVGDHFGASFEFMSLMIESEDLGEVLTLADRASEEAGRLVDEGVLDGYESVATVLPPPARQRQALAWLERHPERTDPSRVRRELSAALRAEGLRPEAFDEGLLLLEEALGVDRPIAPESLSLSAENRRLLERYLRKEEGVWHTVVRLYPPPREWKREPPPAVEELAAELGPRVTLTGVNVVSRHLRQKSKRQAVTAAILGFLLVGALLWLDFGRLGDALLSLVPLAVGIVWMLGFMALLGIEVNLMNIFVTTMIIGIGVDYGIHALHRFREAPPGDVEALSAGLLETGKAIVLAALSTVAGFGSMALSRYPGLESIGYVAILGALSTALVSVTLLPAWFRWRMAKSSAPGKRETVSEG